jgi:hypothetical protein
MVAVPLLSLDRDSVGCQPASFFSQADRHRIDRHIHHKIFADPAGIGQNGMDKGYRSVAAPD